MTRRATPQVQVRDFYVPLPEYCLDPLEITAIGLMVGESRFEKFRLRAKERGTGEFAIIGDSAIHVSLHPPKDMRPPEGWIHEWVKAKFMHQAKEVVQEAWPTVPTSPLVQRLIASLE